MENKECNYGCPKDKPFRDGRICRHQCPMHRVQDGENCLESCPPNKFLLNSTFCTSSVSTAKVYNSTLKNSSMNTCSVQKTWYMTAKFVDITATASFVSYSTMNPQYVLKLVLRLNHCSTVTCVSTNVLREKNNITILAWNFALQ